jgi:hypothetical protein
VQMDALRIELARDPGAQGSAGSADWQTLSVLVPVQGDRKGGQICTPSMVGWFSATGRSARSVAAGPLRMYERFYRRPQPADLQFEMPRGAGFGFPSRRLPIRRVRPLAAPTFGGGYRHAVMLALLTTTTACRLRWRKVFVITRGTSGAVGQASRFWLGFRCANLHNGNPA